MTKKSVQSDEYEKLGRALAEITENSLRPTGAFFRAAFLRGVVTGFGGVIGATLLVALLIWFLSFFDSLPVVDKFIETIRNTNADTVVK